MELSPQTRALFLIGLGGVLLGTMLGYLLHGEAPAVGVAGPPDEGRKGVSLMSEVAAMRVEAAGEEKGATAGATVDFVGKMRGALREVGEWDRQRRLHAVIDQLDPADLEVAAAQVRLLPSGERYEVGAILWERWAAFDPLAALTFSKKMGDDDWRMVRVVFRTWSVAAPDEARAWVEAQPPGNERTGFAFALVAAVGRSNPATAVEIAVRLNVVSGDNWQINDIFRQWAAQAPTAAASAALALPAGEARTNALGHVVRGWAEKDPAAAYAWAKSFGEHAGTRRELIKQTLEAWLKTDPAAAQAHILALPPGAERTAALRSAIGRLHEADELSSALALLAELPAGHARSSAVQDLVLNSEAAGDPQFAQRLYEMTPVGSRRDIVWEIADRMAEKDVAAALRWAMALPQGELRQDARRSVARTWAEKDPRSALDWVLKNDPPTPDSETLKDPFSKWTQAAPNDALPWAAALPAGPTRDALSASAVAGIARRDPQRALALFTELSPEAQARATSELASTLTRNDPASAADLVAQLPAGTARQQALSQIADQWAQADPGAVAVWLDRLPAGAERDAATGSFVFRAAEADPEGALVWAATITDPTQRAERIGDVAESWLRNDPAAARRWLAQTNQLTPKRKAELLKREL